MPRLVMVSVGILVLAAVTTADHHIRNTTNSSNSTTERSVAAGSRRRAVAVLCGGDNSTINGTVIFEKAVHDEALVISGCISGLQPNKKYGFHVHTYGDLRQGCSSTGSHFNPTNSTHGSPGSPVRHAGDLGNLLTDANGEVRIDMTDSILNIGGPNCIVGRAVVLHEKEDDLGEGGNAKSRLTGNAGGRLACGVVGLAECD